MSWWFSLPVITWSSRPASSVGCHGYSGTKGVLASRNEDLNLKIDFLASMLLLFLLSPLPITVNAKP